MSVNIFQVLNACVLRLYIKAEK